MKGQAASRPRILGLENPRSPTGSQHLRPAALDRVHVLHAVGSSSRHCGALQPRPLLSSAELGSLGHQDPRTRRRGVQREVAAQLLQPGRRPSSHQSRQSWQQAADARADLR
eukprot:8614735-Pyramimonas_sp.AAC.1